MHTYSVSLTSHFKPCVSYLMLFLDIKGALFHSPIVLKITMNSIQSQKHFGVFLLTDSSDLGPFRLRIFLHKWGISPEPMMMNQHVKCNERQTRPCHPPWGGRGALNLFLLESPVAERLSSEDRTGAGPGPHMLPTALLRE
jgi:hypothetical protein